MMYNQVLFLHADRAYWREPSGGTRLVQCSLHCPSWKQMPVLGGAAELYSRVQASACHECTSCSSLKSQRLEPRVASVGVPLLRTGQDHSQLMSWCDGSGWFPAIAVNRDETRAKAWVAKLKNLIFFEKISVYWIREEQQGCASRVFLLGSGHTARWFPCQWVRQSHSETPECGNVWKLFTCVCTPPHYCFISS